MVMSPSLTTMMLMWASGARHRVGVAGRGNEFALTLPVPRARHAVHYVDHSAALLSAFGVDPQPRSPSATYDSHAPRPDTADPASGAPRPSGQVSIASLNAPVGGWGVWRPQLYLNEDGMAGGAAQWAAAVPAETRSDPSAPRVRRLVVNVSAGDQTRYWPEDRFIAAITWIRERFPSLALLIVGSPHDHERMERIGTGGGIPVASTPGMRDDDGGGRHGRHRLHRRYVGHPRRLGLRQTRRRHVPPRPGRALRAVRHRRARRLDPGPPLQSLAVAPALAVLDEVITATLPGQ